MRDGIFKSLSMAASWRRFMQKCGRKADHGERTVEAAARALNRDVRSELPSAFWSTVRAHTSSPQRQLDGLGTALPQWSDDSACTPMEKIARLSFARHAEEGVQGRDLLEATLMDTLQAWGRQRVRQVEQQISVQDRVSAGPAFQEARAAASQAAQQVMSELVMGPTAKKPKARRQKLELDEDLRGLP